ncbi:MAG: hypothetical protein JKP95_03710 [Oceanicaulis sp.]|nr:hypothetical protein [Oceanicaulis sp.]
MARFRPYPVLTLLMLPALALLIWLGSWQLDRRAWKVELLAQYAATADAPPITVSEGLCQGLAETGRRAIEPDVDAAARIVRVSGRNAQGAPAGGCSPPYASVTGKSWFWLRPGLKACKPPLARMTARPQSWLKLTHCALKRLWARGFSLRPQMSRRTCSTPLIPSA